MSHTEVVQMLAVLRPEESTDCGFVYSWPLDLDMPRTGWFLKQAPMVSLTPKEAMEKYLRDGEWRILPGETWTERDVDGMMCESLRVEFDNWIEG